NYSSTNGSTNPITYMQLMLEIFDNLTRQITQITKQQNQPYIFSCQVAAHRRYSSDTMQIALAQWKASRKRPDFVLAAPCYMFETGPDFLHLTNESSWLMGEYKSRAMYWTMINRAEKWRPLEPVSVNWTSTEIVIKFHVPCGQLVIDNALAATTPNGGFDLRSGSVIATNITSVTASGDTVTIALSSPAPADALLSYGRGREGDPAQSGPGAGPRGNLRDRHGDFDEVESPSGTSHKLHNACVMFQYSRKTGFN
ncbi:hypothetical protein, partial [Pseudomonas umsongensis]|uniref:hypothetical protein n=1 Tax=Pseudomonas umsongensis TaxID=198618 RepID=UPI00200B0433